jgi:predicted dehydrogenase
VAALGRGVHTVVEKPLTGWFGDGTADFDASRGSKQLALDGALASIDRMLDAEAKSKAMILYAENWVYAPAIQKEREIIEKTRAQVLWMHGEEAHSGSHSKAYGFWRLNGGGALIGKAVHPLTAALYLKRVEGRARDGKPIRPAAVSARVHSLTRLDGFVDRGFLRTDYHDVEDFSATHVVFEDGTIADIFASEIVMGGIHNWLEVMANNHRAVCNINPNTAMQTYNPSEDQFRDIYVVEKIGTKQGWAPTAPDEDFITGFPQEIEAFYHAAATGERPESDSVLGADCISTVYSAYLSAERKGAEPPQRIARCFWTWTLRTSAARSRSLTPMNGQSGWSTVGCRKRRGSRGGRRSCVTSLPARIFMHATISQEPRSARAVKSDEIACVAGGQSTELANSRIPVCRVDYCLAGYVVKSRNRLTILKGSSGG